MKRILPLLLLLTTLLAACTTAQPTTAPVATNPAPTALATNTPAATASLHSCCYPGQRCSDLQHRAGRVEGHLRSRRDFLQPE